jgi:fructosamine-3-kinase
MSLSQSQIEASISTACDKSLSIVSARPCSGGSINDCRIVSMDDGREFFLKSNGSAHKLPGMFELEFRALLLLSEPDLIRVPRPLLYTDEYIVMEAFLAGQQSDSWAEQMGRQLALLHQATVHDAYGFVVDNYLGTSLQKNTWSDCWLDFWRER